MQPHPLVFFLGFVVAGLLLHVAMGNYRFNDDQKTKLDAIARLWGIPPEHFLKVCAALTAMAFVLVIVCGVLLSLKN